MAADLTQQSSDSGRLEPMITQAARSLIDAGVEHVLGVVLADGGYWNAGQITRLRERDLQPIVPTKASRGTCLERPI